MGEGCMCYYRAADDFGGIISGMYFGEYDKGLFYLAMYYVFFVQENGSIKVVVKEVKKDEKSENKAE